MTDVQKRDIKPNCWIIYTIALIVFMVQTWYAYDLITMFLSVAYGGLMATYGILISHNKR